MRNFSVNRFSPIKTLHTLVLSFAAIVILLTSGCASIGNDFPVTDVATIEIGKTTQKQVKEMFGSPWRTGLESGQKTWTYGSYSYGLFQEKNAKDLVIRFDQTNVVASYTFSTTDHGE
jgi:outer membrane protein assembly factor BamE (lipoprotein component of BamABCDE complex)